MSWFGIEVIWLEEFIKKAERFWIEVKPWVWRWIKKVLTHMKSEAIPRTNVNTWVLWNAHRIKQKWLSWRLFNTTNYAKYVHEWNWRYEWNPFFTDTVEAEEWKAELIMNRELSKHLSILK